MRMRRTADHVVQVAATGPQILTDCSFQWFCGVLEEEFECLIICRTDWFCCCFFIDVCVFCLEGEEQ